jgi:hypothetical protein
VKPENHVICFREFSKFLDLSQLSCALRLQTRPLIDWESVTLIAFVIVLSNHTYRDSESSGLLLVYRPLVVCQWDLSIYKPAFSEAYSAHTPNLRSWKGRNAYGF